MTINMKMTRYMLLPLVLAAFAGCSKVVVEDAPATKVTFTVGSYAAQTKADNDSNDHVSLRGDTDSFRSMGFLHAVGVEGTQNFFGENGETISYTGTAASGAWEPSHVYYWPKSSQSYVNFVSWYDATAEAADLPDVITETKLAWGTTDDPRTIEAGDNIMYADEAWHFNANTTPATHGLDNVSQGIPTLFRHALAKVKFQAKAAALSASDPATQYKVSIKSVTLSAIVDKGTLSLTNSDPASDATPVTGPTTREWTGGWTLATGEGTTVNLTKTGDDLNLTTDVQEIPGLVSAVLPQDISDVKVSITYEISTIYGTDATATPYSVEEVPVPDIPLFDANGTGFSTEIDEWEINKIYTYTIIIDPVTNVILFQPDTSDWTEVTGTLPIE